MPTGFVDDVRNRVPSCNRCNQSKGKADWRRWISGNAAGSPKRRGIRDLDDRIQRLEAFEKWGAVEPIQIERLIDAAHWAAHWANRDAILEKMHESQKLAEQMKAMIFKAYSERAKK
jgi:hypothetical protein